MEIKQERKKDTETVCSVEETVLEKRRLRKEILAKRDALPDSLREEYSLQIRRTLQNWEVYRRVKTLLAFVSFGSEVDTRILIQEALAEGKTVYCPRVEENEMIFHRIFSLEDLKPGYRGILEPAKEAEKLDQAEMAGLLLMPGTVFDTGRNRIGYGKGFYDRFMAGVVQKNRAHFGEHNETRIITAALAFSLQVVQNVPVSHHDFRPEYLITEKTFYGPER